MLARPPLTCRAEPPTSPECRACEKFFPVCNAPPKHSNLPPSAPIPFSLQFPSTSHVPFHSGLQASRPPVLLQAAGLQASGLQSSSSLLASRPAGVHVAGLLWLHVFDCRAHSRSHSSLRFLTLLASRPPALQVACLQTSRPPVPPAAGLLACKSLIVEPIAALIGSLGWLNLVGLQPSRLLASRPPGLQSSKLLVSRPAGL